MKCHSLPGMTAVLREHAQACELEARWPLESLGAYRDIGGWRWGIPVEYGGLALSATERLGGFVAAARGDMSTALFITQHEGAVDLVVTSPNQALRSTWLPRFAAGEAFTSIGYSQLTTSNLGGVPAMSARETRTGYRLDGKMPWVTGAPYVANVVCGATLDSGDQVLILLPMDAGGVSVLPATSLAALNSTHTCEVRCDGVELGADLVVSGPRPQVLAERTPVRLLLVSATGVGLAWGMMDLIEEAAARAPNASLPGGWEARLEIARATCARLEARITEICGAATLDAGDIDALRVSVNEWLLRLSAVLMTTVKGGGFRHRSPAQRLAAEAHFFYVWSAPDGLRADLLDRLLPPLP